MDSNKQMADLLFKNITKTPDDYEQMYPKRNLEEGAVVTRFAPSPTGFLHFGGLFAAFIGKTATKSTNGVFYLRIEDTDKKREVENGVSLIVKGLNDFGIEIDEGMLSETDEKGAYGPYTQSKRKDIYQAYVKSLVEQGLAYPCFMTEEELATIREKQESEKLLPGVYGEFAKYRDITVEEAQKRIENGDEYVVRLKSPGKEDKRIKFKDVIKGEIEMPENILDVVLLKKDGTPTYHFAHVVDDHLMRTTHVIRGDEWISSVPIHLQLFWLCGLKPPKYAHISPIMKEENGGKRKLSKRKDPEAAVSYYSEVGYPKGAIWEYLMTLANSNYEDWRLANPNEDIDNFKFSFSKMSKAGALFDMVKLADVSKNYICRLSAEEVYEMVTDWAKENNKKLYKLLVDDEEYAIKPMNCPGGILVYQNEMHSYRDLPLRYAELGLVHRHELSGALHGLFRVRAFTQDDAHVFMLPEQMQSELMKVIELFDRIYNDESQEREFNFKCYGADINPAAIEIAEKNIRSAGLMKYIELRTQPFQQCTEAPQPGIMVTNPPYGERISSRDLLGLYNMIGERVKHVFTGYKVWILSYKDECFDKIGLKPSEKMKLMNGSLECEYRCYDIFEGKIKDYKKALNEEGEARPSRPERPSFERKPDRSSRPNFRTDRMDRPARRFAAAHAEDDNERTPFIPGKRYFGDDRADGRPARRDFVGKRPVKRHFKDDEEFGGKKKFGDRSFKKPFKRRGKDDFED